MSLPRIDLSSVPIATWLALWGAFTGTVAWTIAIYNFFLDRPRLKIRTSPYSDDQARAINVNLTLGGSSRYLLVEVVNAGRRKATICNPEVWCVNELGLLDHESPQYAMRDETWQSVDNPDRLYALGEGDTVTFLFRLAEEDRLARIDVADTLHRFKQHRTLMGDLRWFRAWFKGRRSTKWRSLREAFFGHDRPRHHKDD